MSFTRIADTLQVSASTVRRAFDYKRPEAARLAAENGDTPNRGEYSHLGETKRRRIRKLLAKDRSTAEIASKVGCGTSTVRRIGKEMRAAAANGQAV